MIRNASGEMTSHLLASYNLEDTKSSLKIKCFDRRRAEAGIHVNVECLPSPSAKPDPSRFKSFP